MKLQTAKQRIEERRLIVRAAYDNVIKEKGSVSVLVDGLARKYRVTTVTIYNDINVTKPKKEAE